MTCQHCKYYDEEDRWGRKGYCSYHRRYFYPEDDVCSKFEKKSESGGCFLTSACCEYKGYADDCYELTTLRGFRDGFMKTMGGGQVIIDEYYKIAPVILEKINSSSDKEKEFDYIYSVVEKCVSLIEKNDNERALTEYIAMVNVLRNKYLKEDL